MSSHKEKAIILKRINLGEADRIVTAFSFEHGKIKFVAKGVRRTKSKLAGSIEPFCLVDIQLSTGRSLDILTSANIIKNYLGLSPSFEELKFANFVGEVIDKTIPEEAVSKQIYGIIDETLSNIDDLKILKSYFLAKVFDYLGIFPEVETCLKCGVKPVERLFISKEGGGMLDEDCCLYFSDSHSIDANSIKFLRLLRDRKYSSLKNFNIPERNIIEVEKFLSDYLRHVSNRSFKSEQI